MSLYPLMLKLTGRLALVVGGGPVAARKARSLLAAGARVRLVSPVLAPQTEELTTYPELEVRRRGFEPMDLAGVTLVFAATDHADLNGRVAALARESGALVNVADQPALADFLVPASFRRGDLCVAVGTQGASPAASRLARQRLEQQFGPEWGPFLEIMAAARRAVLARGQAAEANAPVFRELAGGALLDLLAAGDWAGVETLLREQLGLGLDQLGLDPGAWSRGGAAGPKEES